MERPDRPVTTWRKSTHSGGNGSDCVEVATASNQVLVRDTKHRSDTALAFSPAAWQRLTTTLKTTRLA